MTVATPHPAYEHVAVLHHGDDDLARQLAPRIVAGLASGDAMLVCLEASAWTALCRELGPSAELVTHMPASVRYDRPAHAIAVLSRFVQEALASGTRAVWSIGAIGFDGSDRDDAWIRYEAAIDDVVSHLPLRAVCAYDLDALPARIIDAARQTHAVVDEGNGAQASPEYGRRLHAAHIAATVPDTVPDIEVEPSDSDVARRTIESAYGSRVAPDRLSDVNLVATELVTNSLRHGAAPVRIRTWLDDGVITLQVADHGSGITHPFPELRPPVPSTEGGYGLWLVGQLADQVVVERDDDLTVVTATVAV